MATEIDELIIRIKADTKQLDAALKKVGNDSKKAGNAASSGFARTLASIRAVGPAAVLAGGAIASAFAIKSVINVGREFENLRVSLNTVYGSAAGGKQAFDDIQKFAMESPFQVQDLTQAFIQLKAAGIEPSKKQLDIFTDAASVTTDALESFQAMIRITQRSTAGGLGLEELNQIADRGIPVFEILQQKLGRTRLELGEIGKTAEGAAQVMGALEEGLAERFGGATAAKMETLNQKLSNMQTAFSALAASLYEDGGIGSAIKSLVDDITSAVTEMNTLFQMTSTGMSRDFVTASTDEDRLEVLNREIAEQNAKRKDVPENIARGTSSDKRAKAANQRLATETSPLQEMRDTIIARLELTKLENDQAKTKQQAQRREQEASEQQAAQDQKRADRLKELKKTIQKTISPTEILAGKIADLRDILNKNDKTELLEVFGTTSLEEASASIDILSAQLQGLLDKAESASLKKLNDELKDVAVTFDSEMKQAVINTSSAFTGEFVNALLDGQNALESFKNFAKSLVAQIIQIFLQMAVVNNILNSVFSLTGQNALPTIGGIGSGGGTGGFNSLRSGSGPTQIPLGMPPRAGGGAVMSGSGYMVGERGPELFVPNTSGSIKNAQQTRSMAGGASPIVVNQNLNFALGVVPTVRAEIQKQLPQISQTAKIAVLEAVQRGGAYRKGLHGA